MFYQIFHCTKVKGNMIFSNKNGIYGLPQKLPSDIRFNDLKKFENFRKTSKLYGIVLNAESSSQINFLSIIVKNY